MDFKLAENQTSDFLNIKLKKDGTVSKSSQVETRENFNIMEAYMKKTVIKLDKSIKSGNIDISPYRDNGMTACRFCDFKEVCMFDTAFDRYRSLISNADKAVEFMKKEVEEDE